MTIDGLELTGVISVISGRPEEDYQKENQKDKDQNTPDRPAIPPLINKSNCVEENDENEQQNENIEIFCSSFLPRRDAIRISKDRLKILKLILVNGTGIVGEH